MFYLPYLYLFAYTGFKTRLSYDMIYVLCNRSGATNGAGTVHLSGAPVFTTGFVCGICLWDLQCSIFSFLNNCSSLLSLFICQLYYLFFFQFTASDYSVVFANFRY